MTHPVAERTYAYAVAPSSPAAILSKSGLEAMRAILAGELAPPPIAGTLDFTLTHIEEGVAHFEGDSHRWVQNPLGVVHGGYIATLLDSALGCAVHTNLAAGIGYTSATLEVKFLRAVRAETGRLRAEARVVHPGAQLAVAEARLVGVDDGKLYATATSTCFVFDARAHAGARSDRAA